LSALSDFCGLPQKSSRGQNLRGEKTSPNSDVKLNRIFTLELKKSWGHDEMKRGEKTKKAKPLYNVMHYNV